MSPTPAPGIHLPDSPIGCPMDAMLRMISGPWTAYMMWILQQKGPTRFSELKKEVGEISAKVLTERLRMLEDAGVISRTYTPTIPPKVIYELTDPGKELVAVFGQLYEIAIRWAKPLPQRKGKGKRNA